MPASCAYRTTTTSYPGAVPVIADHLNRDFTAPAPRWKLVGDITKVPTWQGWLYLATVIDCHTKAPSSAGPWPSSCAPT